MKERYILLTVGIALISIGVIGTVVDQPSESTTPENIERSNTLRVEEAVSAPRSTINQLQGAGSSLQNNQSQLQNSSTGTSLQPNAGTDRVPGEL